MTAMRIKRLSIMFFLTFILTMTCTQKKQNVANELPPDSLHTMLLARASVFDPSADFTKLRMNYAKTLGYNPYEGNSDLETWMLDAFRKKQYQNAVSYGEVILGKNYLDIQVHKVCEVSYLRLKDFQKSNFHSFFVKGLINSILNSGDGKTPATAYHVISVKEEYAILDFIGCKSIGHRLIEIDTHSYDKLAVIWIKTNKPDTLYFNVDIPLNWINSRLGK